ncbi:MAG: AbrB/MazE/SpoVT family DNA-binding domain-containing protein [Methanomassiliicoccales archaeon]|nr:AbrB/MazE/SpoVT family DNA-binding domain-containing protein [Methanomassiliicoccales archaeon]
MAEARITAKGQVTIPKKIMEIIGAEEGDYLLFFQEGGKVTIEAGRLASKQKREAKK